MRRTHAIVRAVLSWFSKNARDLPWRRTRDPYAIWVSEIMLQQTQVKTVLPYWKRWMRELPTIESVANARVDKIHKLWEGLGYYTRVRNLQKAAQIILEKHGGKFPQKFDDVLVLPGIGRYTAGAICSIAFNQPTPILDGNVIRVLTRIFGVAENPREKETNRLLWEIAKELVFRAKSAKEAKTKKSSRTLRPPREANACSFLNQSLMELGALVCTPRNPHCSICPAQKLCVAFKESRVEELPNLGRREKATARHFVAFVVEHDGKFLVRRRPAGIVNAHLWEFPNFETNGKKKGAREIFRSVYNFEPEEFNPLCTVKHSITRYRITLEAFRVQLKKSPKVSGGIWLPRSKFDSLAFTAAHKKLASFAANRILTRP
ncbi:MAG TPA: A/G-specific adenine glycosylase [Candidatus Aquilonibacter sp.]|nr:A/G-specific adenine glycosylase [Candidatus Aquilonibacter sp.]